jgi:hypothetical protein
VKQQQFSSGRETGAGAVTEPRMGLGSFFGDLPETERTGSGASTGSVAALCDRCGRGPIRPGDQCGWCGRRARRLPNTSGAIAER